MKSGVIWVGLHPVTKDLIKSEILDISRHTDMGECHPKDEGRD